MKQAELRAQVGYKRHPWVKNRPSADVAENHLKQQFNVKQPDHVWVTDITYILTYEG